MHQSRALLKNVLIAGSEPSLVNHAPSSTPASKRTLTSHDPQPANGSVDNLDHSVDSEAKSPSYVKLSCAVSGYSSNKYNAFNSEDKVKKTKPPLPHKPAPLRGASRTNGSDATSVSLVSVTVDTDETDSCRVNGTSPRTPLVNGQRPQQHDNDVPTPQKVIDVLRYFIPFVRSWVSVLCVHCVYLMSLSLTQESECCSKRRANALPCAHVLHFERGLRQTLIMVCMARNLVNISPGLCIKLIPSRFLNFDGKFKTFVLNALACNCYSMYKEPAYLVEC